LHYTASGIVTLCRWPSGAHRIFALIWLVAKTGVKCYTRHIAVWKRWVDNIRMDLQEGGCGLWTGLGWPRIETGGGSL